MIVSCIVFFTSILLLFLFGNKDGQIYTLIIAVSSMSYCLLLVNIGFYLSIQSKIADFLGKISYELYLYQGIAYLITVRIIKENSALAIPVLLCVLISLSFLMFSIKESVISTIYTRYQIPETKNKENEH